MGNAMKRTKGALKEAAGKVQKKAGELVGNERVAGTGRMREREGKAEQATAKSRERVKGAVEEVVGKVQRKVGDLVDDRETHAKGAVREQKGRLRQKANQ